MSKSNVKAPNVLSLSWRDIQAPKAGGAEVYTHEVLRYAVSQGAEVTQISMAYSGCEAETTLDGVRYLRSGGALGVILAARRYYRTHCAKIDVVVDQCNTHRFFTRFWVPQPKRLFLIFQLTREVWDCNMPFPANKIGKALENAMLRLNRRDRTVTISQSTKDELVALGFSAENISIVPISLPEEAALAQAETVAKSVPPAFIYIGRYAKYKGIDHAVRALALVRDRYPNAKLWLVGKPDQAYIQTTLEPLCRQNGLTIGTEEQNAVIIKGFVSEQEKFRLCAAARALLFPSVREGWGIIVSEAAIVGTPSIVFNSPGCRDAVDFGRAGYLCHENSANELARLMAVTLDSEATYAKVSEQARLFAQSLSSKQTDEGFYRILLEACNLTSLSGRRYNQ